MRITSLAAISVALLATVGLAAKDKDPSKKNPSPTEDIDDDGEDDVSPLMTPPVPPSRSRYVMPDEPKYNYAEVIHKSYLFYHSQKSGILPYQRLAWRGDSCKVCVGDFNEDLSRGWYEAANTMKWGLPFGWTATQLAFNVVIFEDAMSSVNELAEGLELLKWGAGQCRVSFRKSDT